MRRNRRRPVELAEYPEDLRRQVDNYLAELSFSKDQSIDGLVEAMRYSLLAGGKRVRPVLCLTTGRSLGIELSTLMPVAAALEMIHTYSLIHDDLPALDDGQIRRGQPTCHVEFGEDVALLAGDALFAESFLLIVRELDVPSENKLAVSTKIAEATGVSGMVGGQFIDVSKGTEMDAAELLHMHMLKTGRLIEVSVTSALCLLEVEERVSIQLREFAQELGVLFQIVDDILDATGSEEETGKTSGSDERHEKNTYVSTFGLYRAHELSSKSHSKARAALGEIEDEIDDTEVLCEITDFIYERTR